MMSNLNKVFYLLFVVSITFFSCDDSGSNLSRRSVNSFNIQPNKLKAGDSLILLYLSSYQDVNENDKDLIQIVAQQLETGDTVNILTFNVRHIGQDAGDYIFRYKPFSDEMQQRIEIASRFYQHFVDNLDSLSDVQKFEHLQSDSMLMVLVDDRFEKIGKTHYPTVFGNVRR